MTTYETRHAISDPRTSAIGCLTEIWKARGQCQDAPQEVSVRRCPVSSPLKAQAGRTTEGYRS